MPTFVPPSDLDRIVAVLERGEPIVLPTDTVYGLAVLPGRDGAVDQLFALKQRRADVPVAVLCHDVGQALDLAASDDVLAAAADALWPGPLTLVIERRSGLDWELGDPADTIGVRCPRHPLLQDLARRVGPIAASSANLHGQPTPSTAAAVARMFDDQVVVVDGGELGGSASTVVDTTTRPWTILRAGPITAADLAAAGAPIPRTGG